MKAPKGLAVKIAEKMSPKGKDAEEPAEDMGDTALTDAGAEVLEAMRAGDDAAFASSLKSFVKICGMKSYEE